MKAINIKNYFPQKEDKFFLDTNIWIFLYGPYGSTDSEKTSKYSSFVKEITSQKCKIYTSSCVISEFINRYLRYGHSNSRYAKKPYKNSYKKSNEYKRTFGLLKESFLKNFKDVILLDDNFSKTNLNDLLKISEKTDFNDVIISHILKTHGIPLVTDDGDFKNLLDDIKIYTSNLQLLSN